MIYFFMNISGVWTFTRTCVLLCFIIRTTLADHCLQIIDYVYWTWDAHQARGLFDMRGTISKTIDFAAWGAPYCSAILGGEWLAYCITNTNN